MSPPSLSNCPAELLIQVYKLLDNVKDVTALNLVSHQFYSLWLSHTLSISDAVLSHTIKSFNDARKLVELQQKFLERDHCDDDGHHDPYRRALERNKLMISNDQNSVHLSEVVYELSPAAQTVWSKVYYCLRILVLTTEDTFAQSSYVASLELGASVALYELVRHELFIFKNRGMASVTLRFGLERFGGKPPGGTLKDILDILGNHLLALRSAKKVGNGGENVHDVAFRWSMNRFLDSWQKTKTHERLN